MGDIKRWDGENPETGNSWFDQQKNGKDVYIYICIYLQPYVTIDIDQKLGSLATQKNP